MPTKQEYIFVFTAFNHLLVFMLKRANLCTFSGSYLYTATALMFKNVHTAFAAAPLFTLCLKPEPNLL